jgi:hypothetical protein
MHIVLFEMYDIDNDGLISSHELQLLFKTAMGFVHHLHAPSLEVMSLRDMLSQQTYDWWHEQRAIVLKFSETNGGKISFEVILTLPLIIFTCLTLHSLCLLLYRFSRNGPQRILKYLNSCVALMYYQQWKRNAWL